MQWSGSLPSQSKHALYRCFIHSFLVIPQTKSRMVTVLTFRASNLNLPHNLFPAVPTEEFNKTGPCTSFSVLSLLAGDRHKAEHQALGPEESGWGCQFWATTFPLSASPHVWLWWFSHSSWQPPHFPPTIASCPSGAGGVMQCLCIPLLSPPRPHL